MKRIGTILLSILLIIACALALASCGETPDFAQFNGGFCTHWMEEVADSALLSTLSMPGTHDSGAYRSGIVANLGKDQNYNIRDQLNMGVRFLDIRLVLDDGELRVYHGVIDEKLSFDGVLNMVRSFLAENPTECVLMCIKKEDGESITAAVHEAIEAEPDLWYTEEAIPTMGEVRGKIVLFRRFEDEGAYGVDLYTQFADNCAFAIDGPVKCYVQDYYNVETKEGLPSKWDKIVETFEYAKTSAPDEYVINFTSAYYNKKFIGQTVPAIQNTADFVHEKLATYVFEHAHYGIVLFDFIDYQHAVGLVLTNFQAKNLNEYIKEAA